MGNNGRMTYFGGSDAYAMGGVKTLEDLEYEKIEQMHNDAIDARKAALDAQLKTELEKAQEITDKMNSMEIMPCGSYILVRPYSKNPYEKIEITDSGLIIPEIDGHFKNPDTGEEDMRENFSCQGTVIEVGPLVKWIKEGDDIFYRRAQAVPVPFFRQGFEVVPEQCIQCVINEGIKNRWDAIKYPNHLMDTPV